MGRVNKMITSIQNPKVKLVRGLLASKKEREENGLFIIEGVRLAEEADPCRVKPELHFIFQPTLRPRARDPQ